ncbi:hypothetical protein V8G54_029987 [Vigna mungo]|uniref:Uncharacterized protein n=1 Tax=Vigna mungo TaxID=3915 RepID=A0AAQ3MVH8_VIGMU
MASLKKQAVELWGQIVNIYKRPFLRYHSIEINLFSIGTSIVNNVNPSRTKPTRPLCYRRKDRWHAAIYSIPAIVTLTKSTTTMTMSRALINTNRFYRHFTKSAPKTIIFAVTFFFNFCLSRICISWVHITPTPFATISCEHILVNL